MFRRFVLMKYATYQRFIIVFHVILHSIPMEATAILSCKPILLVIMLVIMWFILWMILLIICNHRYLGLRWKNI